MASPCIAYYADDLPAPLPSITDIHGSNEIFKSQPTRMVVGIGEHFIVKYGGNVDLTEGETLLYLESTTVPAPRIYAMFQDQNTKKNYVIMERIKGRTLEAAYLTLDEAAKTAIATRLRSIIGHMRTLPSPDPNGNPCCSVGRRGLPDGMFWTDDPAAPFAGPFRTEDELNEGMVANCRKDGLSEEKAGYYSRVFQQVLRNHPAVFTHGDLHRENIIIRDDGEDEKNLDIFLIDFKLSG